VDSGERGGERAAPARVEIEPPHGPGDVPAEQLAVEMRRRASGFRACYEHALHGGPGLRGRLELRFRLARDGRAYGVQVADDQVGDAGLARCLARVVAATPFGFGSSGEEIRVPLIFVSR
jgi:hypothetical protein